LRLAGTGEIGAALAVGEPVSANVGQDVPTGAPVVEIHGRDGRRLAGGFGGEVLPDAQQSFGVWIGQRLEEHPVHDAEDRAVCPDPQRQGEHGNGGERAVLGEGPKGESDVLLQPLESLW
jgi:hypothetical protein